MAGIRRDLLSRRRVLTYGGLAGAGLTAWLAVGCGDDDDKQAGTASPNASATFEDGRP